MLNYKFSKNLDLGNKALYYGDFDFSMSPLALVLNSRQTKTPAGDDLWVVNTIEAIKYAIENNWPVVTSLGMNTWELTLWACSEYGGRQIIVAPAKDEAEREKLIARVVDDFQLDSAKTGWLFFEPSRKSRSAKTDWPTRDKLAVEVADIVLPVSIRPEGNLDVLIRNQREKKIINRFNAWYSTKSPGQSLNPEKIEPAVPTTHWDYITHWTRTCYGPWPGEKPDSFYRRLNRSGYRYPGSGLETLKNILTEMTIRASSDHLRGSIKGVAFSSLHPVEILPLMRWRKRYVRWGFEPYGIAISRKAAIAKGIQPVIYAKPELYDRLLDSDKPYFQNHGEAGAWREECEWRYLGDLDLRQFNSDDLRIITYNQSEINYLKNITDARVISFT